MCLQEEIAQLRRKVERMKKIELAETLDEVMAEELREYKETLTCPSCKVKRKDAVLTKCFHVFCWDCLRTRYETRQRKCPKCNCAFGANDYHRLYLSTWRKRRYWLVQWCTTTYSDRDILQYPHFSFFIFFIYYSDILWKTRPSERVTLKRGMITDFVRFLLFCRLKGKKLKMEIEEGKIYI